MGIKFGTDGWRAVISDEFTFGNLRLVAQAVADYLHATASASQIAAVVGFDTRFLSDRYAREAAAVLAGNGIRVYLSRSDAPTPAISFAVPALGAQGGVMITASHNPPRYNGFKLKADYGGAAGPQQNLQVEAFLEEGLRRGREPRRADVGRAEREGLIERFDPMPAYIAHLRRLVGVEGLAGSGLRVVVDPMYGSGRGYLANLLRQAGLEVLEIHGEMNPGFGGIHPEPIARNLEPLQAALAGGGWHLGLATDGDADRIGAMDSAGRFVDPHAIFALALRYLVERQGQRGAVVKTVSTTQMVNRLAARYGLPLHETPVGFNFICDLMRSEDVLIGGEESGGISIKGHIPEGDGILMGLLLARLVADAGVGLDELLQSLHSEVGPCCYARRDVQIHPFDKAQLTTRLTEHPPATLAGQAVVAVNGRDGVKYLLADDGWLLIRPSGTEPVLRIYAEAGSPDEVEALLAAGERLGVQALPHEHVVDDEGGQEAGQNSGR
ncbi:MAG: phosphoglucomutase/phosphomannomutase family protein [Chloroflexi bacterium]|nr:phosphoglucomutase/phosphomannomutase family protein [Chloroflexota bacterium]